MPGVFGNAFSGAEEPSLAGYAGSVLRGNDVASRAGTSHSNRRHRSHSPASRRRPRTSSPSLGSNSRSKSRGVGGSRRQQRKSRSGGGGGGPPQSSSASLASLDTLSVSLIPDGPPVPSEQLGQVEGRAPPPPTRGGDSGGLMPTMPSQGGLEGGEGAQAAGPASEYWGLFGKGDEGDAGEDLIGEAILGA